MNPLENRKKAQGVRTKADCVRAAVEVFARKGFHRAKLDDIADAAGVTRGALYWHYRTKEAFLIAVLETFRELWSPKALQNFPLQGRADLLISRWFNRFASNNRKVPWLNRLGFIVALDAENIDPRVGEIIAEIEATNRWFFATLFRYGQRTAVFDDRWDPEKAGAILATTQSGLLASWYQDPKGYDLELLTDSMVRAVLDGLLAEDFRAARPKRAPLAEIRRIDKQLDRFLGVGGSPFTFARKAAGQV